MPPVCLPALAAGRWASQAPVGGKCGGPYRWHCASLLPPSPLATHKLSPFPNLTRPAAGPSAEPAQGSRLSCGPRLSELPAVTPLPASDSPLSSPGCIHDQGVLADPSFVQGDLLGSMMFLVLAWTWPGPCPSGVSNLKGEGLQRGWGWDRAGRWLWEGGKGSCPL